MSLQLNIFEVPYGQPSGYKAIGDAYVRRIVAGLTKLAKSKGASSLVATALITHYGEPSFAVEITLASDGESCPYAAEVFDWVIPLPAKELDYPSSSWTPLAKSSPHKIVPLTAGHLIKLAVQMLFTEVSHAAYMTSHVDVSGSVAIDLLTGAVDVQCHGREIPNPTLSASPLEEVALQVQVPQAFNPGLARCKDEVLVTLRRANYRLCPRAGIVFTRDHGIFVSHTELATFKSGKVKGTRRLGDKSATALAAEKSSLEDLRIFPLGDTLYALGNIKRREIDASAERTLMCLAQVNVSKGVLENAQGIESPTGSRIEKNWMALVKDERLYFVYNIDPLTIYEFDVSGGLLTKVAEFESDEELRACRGGSQFVEYAGGFLGVVHVKTFGRQRAIYRNKFVWISKDFQFLRTSALFTLRNEPVEFVSSLLVENDAALIGVGYNDSIAAVERVSCAVIDRWLGEPRQLRSVA